MSLPTNSTWYTVDQYGDFHPLCSIKGKDKIAILIHGIGENRFAVQALGQFLAGQEFGKKKKRRYDAVLVYEYDTYTYDINQTAALFVQSFLSIFRHSCPKIDAYPVSSAPIILLTAIKSGGLGGAIKRVFSFSGIFSGLPKTIVDIIRALYAGFDPRLANAPFFTDITEGSPFITKFTSTASPYRNCLKLFTIIGTNYFTYAPLLGQVASARSIGEVINAAYTLYYGNPVANDGIVVQSAAIPATLSLESVFWAVCPQAKVILAVDHSTAYGLIYDPTPADAQFSYKALPSEIITALLRILNCPVKPCAPSPCATRCDQRGYRPN